MVDALNRRIRIERQVACFFPLGSRAFAENLIAIDQRPEELSVVDLLAHYGRLTPTEVQVTGGDRFPFRAPREVQG